MEKFSFFVFQSEREEKGKEGEGNGKGKVLVISSSSSSFLFSSSFGPPRAAEVVGIEGGKKEGLFLFGWMWDPTSWLSLPKPHLSPFF